MGGLATPAVVSCWSLRIPGDKAGEAIVVLPHLVGIWGCLGENGLCGISEKPIWGQLYLLLEVENTWG